MARKHDAQRPYREFLRRVVETAGVSPEKPKAFSFRLKTGSNARTGSGWLRISKAVVAGLLSDSQDRGFLRELENLVHKLASSGRAVQRLIHAGAETLLQCLESHFGRRRKPRAEYEDAKGSRKKPRAKHLLQKIAAPRLVKTEDSPFAAQPFASVFEIPADVLSDRTRRFLVIRDDQGRVLGYVDFHWDSVGRRRALKQLAYMRYRHGLALHEEERSLRRTVAELSGRIRELETLLLVGCHPPETSLAECIELQQQLDSARFYKHAFEIRVQELIAERQSLSGLKLVG